MISKLTFRPRFLKWFRGRRRVAAILAIPVILGITLSVPSPAHGQTFAGNVGVKWSIPKAPAGVNALTFPIKVGSKTARMDGTYFAMQYDFIGKTNGAYVGLQPRPDVNRQQRLRAVFSSFIVGTTSADPNCQKGADGGPGVSCGVEFNAVYGRTYKLKVKRSTGTTWTGVVTDATTGKSTHIGKYTLPSNSGLLRPKQTGFVEYFDAPTCSKQPYYDVTFGKPSTPTRVGFVSWDSIYGKCQAFGKTTHVKTADGGLRITRGVVGRPVS